MATISASVGKNGVNQPDDVRTIQLLLNRIPPAQGGPDPQLTVDGLIGPKTIQAIEGFQQHHAGLVADGRVDPNGATLAKLNQIAGESAGTTTQITFGQNANQAVVSAYTLGVLRDILTAAALTSARIESATRTPEDQARIMYDNIETHGVAHQKALYGSNGGKVIDVYVTAKAAGKTATEIKAAMLAKILELGPSNVSRHLADPSEMNVIDIAPSSITNRPAFEQAVHADARVSKFITPPEDPAYHLEIPQP